MGFTTGDVEEVEVREPQAQPLIEPQETPERVGQPVPEREREEEVVPA